MPPNSLDAPKTPGSFSLSGTIAWFSLFLLSAASGRMLDDQWQGIWARAGAFGLAAAVGLGGISKARHLREKRVRDLAARVNLERLDGRLTRLNAQSAALQLIDDAINRLNEHVTARQRQGSHSAHDKKHAPPNLFPLDVFPIENEGEGFDLGSARSIAGSLQTIASRVVTFEHDHAFSESVVLLTFTLEKDQKLCFVVEILWTHVLAERFVSSGAVIAVGVPADQTSEAELVASGSE